MTIRERAKYKTGKIRTGNISVILDAAEEEFATYGYRGATMSRIAERAKMPRPNVHYYFKNKQELYNDILMRILEEWNEPFNRISPEDDPAEALKGYIHAKVMLSKAHPKASKIFATEIIQGAPHLEGYLAKDHREWVNEKAEVIQSWIDQGKMDKVDPFKLMFMIWGTTQHFADFNYQVLSVLGKRKYSDAYFEEVADDLSHIILKGCGLSAD